MPRVFKLCRPTDNDVYQQSYYMPGLLEEVYELSNMQVFSFCNFSSLRIESHFKLTHFVDNETLIKTYK